MPPDPTNNARERATGNNRSPLSEPCFRRTEQRRRAANSNAGEREQAGRLCTGEPSSTEREGQHLPTSSFRTRQTSSTWTASATKLAAYARSADMSRLSRGSCPVNARRSSHGVHANPERFVSRRTSRHDAPTRSRNAGAVASSRRSGPSNGTKNHAAHTLVPIG